jgi:hypothetical protein
MVVALGIIPEAIAFSIVAGVDPQVGLFGSICILIVVALLGGRPAMVSACTAGVALLMGGLVQSHGLPYLLAASILAGVFQILWGYLRLAQQMRLALGVGSGGPGPADHLSPAPPHQAGALHPGGHPGDQWPGGMAAVTHPPRR